ncbi:cadmium-translocating P-type ATPase [Spongiibacter taiwanensis]|uniref:heavy metal translocating P-type ATPase n=1 Tax=Spongiibacter taiwanensis TaxID=1748242 RepID=UPI002034DC8C|nr:heavy metal translocating P-type ATPase [Spongiibacter taiwanensis]USA43028.1 cadmium-translocating P-type ATPase [Spongiibacter taiwanensis]
MTPPAPGCTCFHCGQPVPPNLNLWVTVAGQQQPLCCDACLAVSQCILGAGLDDFYRMREQTLSRRQPSSKQVDYRQYDDESVYTGFSRCLAGDWESQLAISDLHCSACAWLIEHQLLRLTGVKAVQVNLQRGLATVTWQPGNVKISQIFQAIWNLGYPVQPWSAEARSAQMQTEINGLLRRVGVAGIAMMQLGMVAIALYAGAFQDMDSTSQALLRVFSLLVATPVILYAAQPFFWGALRNLRAGQVGMDVPIALALAAAYGASALATLRQQGEVYFDTVSMFCFFLLLSRYLQALVQRRQEQSLRPLLPLTARRRRADGQLEWKALSRIAVGDELVVEPGEMIPADGDIISGTSSIEDSAFTGEFLPSHCAPGQAVLAGSRNVEASLTIRVRRPSCDSRIVKIDQLLCRAQANKPAIAALADRLGRGFVLLVLALAGGSYLLWSQLGGHDPFLTALAVLVVSCPCALSLATPSCYTAAVNGLRKLGLLVSNAAALESVDQITHVIFDKTGTLTEGEPELLAVESYSGQHTAHLVALAAALEANSNHPIALAFRPDALSKLGYQPSPIDLKQPQIHSGRGIEGVYAGRYYRIGSASFCSHGTDPGQMPNSNAIPVFLSEDGQLIGRFLIADKLRQDAPALMDFLHQRGIKTLLLSGDHSHQVGHLARRLGVDQFQGSCSPDDKLSVIRQLQAYGATVMMVGDGVNDAPIIAAADISVAMASGSDLTRSQADICLLRNQLISIKKVFTGAAKMKHILKQNLLWALLYNLTALPAAALGLVPPWAAAIGMSLSSLIVVLNALRIDRIDNARQSPTLRESVLEVVHG